MCENVCRLLSQTLTHLSTDARVVCCKSIFHSYGSSVTEARSYSEHEEEQTICRSFCRRVTFVQRTQRTQEEWSSHVNVNSVGTRFMQTFCVCPSSHTEKHIGIERAKLGVGSTISKCWKVSSFPQICPVGSLLCPCWDKTNQFPSLSITHIHTHTHSS